MRRRRILAGVLVVAVLGGGVVLVVTALGRGPAVALPRCTVVADGVGQDLTPEQSGNAATIAAVAVRRDLPARAVTIAIATAVQESGLRNLDYGDRDSLGLFQQRPSQGWGSAEQVQDPAYASNAFYDVLTEVEGYEGLEVTDAAQRVQRSAFPAAYADHEPVGRAWASALAGWSPAALTCRLRPAEAAGDPDSVASRLERDLGETGASVPDGEPLRLTVPGEAGDAGARRDWAVAHWTVAQAQGLDVVAVGVAGRVWRRDEPDAGWVDAPEATDGPGVVIDVAAG